MKEDGTREVLSVVNHPTEGASNWLHLFEQLKLRGLEEVDLVISDGLKGIENAVNQGFPGTIWGIGTNIPHLLDDEGELMNKQWYHMADIYDAENYLTFSFSFDSTQTEECIYLSLDYNADYEGTKQKTISYLGSTEKLQSFGYQ